MANQVLSALKKDERLVKGKMKISYIRETIDTMIDKRNKVRFDLAIQRKKVWTPAQKSLFIHTLLEGYPFPPVYAEASDDDILWFLDGQQRMTTIYDYYDNKFPLATGIDQVLHEDLDGNLYYEDVEGLFFDGLSEAMKKQFLKRTVDITEMKNMTPEQRDEMFKRLNGGTALTKFELVRVDLGEDNTAEINNIANMALFSHYANIGDKARTRFQDQVVILQCMILLMNRNSGIENPDINNFIQNIKQIGFSQDLLEKMESTTHYLQDAFELTNEKIRNKMLKKVHIPMLFVTAQKAMSKKIAPKLFEEWAIKFLITDYRADSVYSAACSAGSAKKGAVITRLTVMDESLETKFPSKKKDTVIVTDGVKEDEEFLPEQAGQDKSEQPTANPEAPTGSDKNDSNGKQKQPENNVGTDKGKPDTTANPATSKPSTSKRKAGQNK